MIGYDFDGVLISDLSWDGKDLEKFQKQRDEILPNFRPLGEQCIITGRPYEDKPYTFDYVEKHFSENPPRKIYHDNDSFQNSARYKSQVIQTLGIKKFIESDPGQAVMIQSIVGEQCEVIYFERFINEALSKLS